MANTNDKNFVNVNDKAERPEVEGRKEGDDIRQDNDLHGEHTAKAPELGSNSVADKLPKGKVHSDGGGM